MMSSIAIPTVSGETLTRKNDEMWSRIDLMMEKTMKEFRRDEDISENEARLPWENEARVPWKNERKEDMEDFEVTRNQIVEEEEELRSGSITDVDFCRSILSDFRNHVRKGSFRKKNWNERTSLSKQRSKVTINDLQEKSDANEKVVNQIYGEENSISNEIRPDSVRQSIFTRRLSVDPIETVFYTLENFENVYQSS